MPAVAFVGAYIHLRTLDAPQARRARQTLIVVVCFWLLHAGYEWLMYTPPESVPIRIDLLFVTPLAYVMFFAGVVAYVSGLRRHHFNEARGFSV